MAVKRKKRTPKQIAATKRLVAFNKKRKGKTVKAKGISRSKTATKKRTVKKAKGISRSKTATKKVAKKKAIGRKSQVTKKRPTARLKRRRAKPKKKGYFPNPINEHVVQVTQKNYPSNIGYLTKSGTFNTELKLAKKFNSKADANFSVKLMKNNGLKGWSFSVKKL